MEMASLLETIIVQSTIMPFRWHECKYMCFYCSEHFIESSMLKDHLETHNDIEVDIHELVLRTVHKPQRIKLDVSQISCTVCSSEADTFEDYVWHLFECCGKEFDPEIVSRFEIFKLTDEDLSCLECGQIFTHFGPLLNHTHQTHLDAEKKKRFLCEICGQGFANEVRVRAHIKQTHCAQKCLYCTESFQTRYKLDKHVGEVHKTERLKCPVCSVSLSSRYQKKRHLAFVHDVKSVQLSCYICGKVFVRNNKLLNHIRCVHLKEKNVNCDICGMCCFDTVALKKHRVCHSEESSFECAICGKSFRRKRGLATHITQFHATEEYLTVV